MKRLNGAASAAALCLAFILAGCGQGAEPSSGTVAGPVDRTVAEVIDAEGSLSGLEGVIKNGGLETVLSGTGPYTVFAPSDAALGAAASELTGEAMRAQSAALLRAHIVPGALTRADIGAAIDRKGGPVEMRNVADGVLTFAKEGDTIVITDPNGGKARLTGSETLASNGVVQPIDASLASPAA